MRNQLALENQEAGQNAQQQDVNPASSGIERMVSDGRPHVFVVGSALGCCRQFANRVRPERRRCGQLRTPPPADATVANVVVLSSKGGPGVSEQATVLWLLADLQEMQNHMRETIDQGLQDLQAKQGTGGLPALPPSAKGDQAPALYASAAPPPDSNVAAEIQSETQQGDQVETEASNDARVPMSAAPQAPPVTAPSAAPATVELGQTPARCRPQWAPPRGSQI